MSESAYQRDEDFAYFIEKFGEPTDPYPADPAVIEKYRGRLPDQLITYWEHEGWGAWQNGLFWVVNPDEYRTVVDAWLEETPLPKQDTWHCIARSAFGALFLCGEKMGPVVTVEPLFNFIAVSGSNLKERSKDELDFKIRSFFAFMGLKDCDSEDENGQPLFKRALKKLGPLGKNEMYGYDHMLVAGGPNTLDNLVRTELESHLLVLRDLGGPPALPFLGVDMDGLAQKALQD